MNQEKDYSKLLVKLMEHAEELCELAKATPAGEK